MDYPEKEFKQKFITLENLEINYYESPLLNKFKFLHAFLTKKSSEFDFVLLTERLKKGNKNYFIKQFHSNNIVLASDFKKNKELFADGIISNKANQNLWIYSADCMPILLADKTKRRQLNFFMI